MKARIIAFTEKKLIGYNQQMSYANYNPAVLWQSFMPQRKEIINTVSADLFSI